MENSDVSKGIAKQDLIRESAKIGKDIILFDAYGMSYYGNLQAVDDCYNVALLGPAKLSASGLVEILTPSEIIAVENIVSVDLRMVIAKGTDISADPFVIPEDADGEADERTIAQEKRSRRASPAGSDGQRSHMLIHRLNQQIGELVSITTRGGFLFAGQLADIEEGKVMLIVDTIFAPGGDGSALFSIGSAAVSLEAVISVSS
jgi:hypothetical protein